jgi:hypothetical protein
MLGAATDRQIEGRVAVAEMQQEASQGLPNLGFIEQKPAPKLFWRVRYGR